jgi:DNA primase
MSDALDDINKLTVKEPALRNAKTIGDIIKAAKELTDIEADEEQKHSNLNTICQMISQEDDVFKRADAISKTHKLFGQSKGDMSKVITALVTRRQNREADMRILTSDDPEERLPDWCSAEQLYADGFTQLTKEKRGYKIGIYFKGTERALKRVTNYSITPVAHIQSQDNSRRLVEIIHQNRRSVVELSDRAMISEDSFSSEIISKGPFRKEPSFSKHHFLCIIGYIVDHVNEAQEINTLGWNPNGFFAFSNKIGIPGIIPPLERGQGDLGVEEQPPRLIDFNDFGIADVDKKLFYSPSISKANSVELGDDNMYENDLYLTYRKSHATFGEWSKLFIEVYGDRGRFGMAFLFISIFKDIITRVTKCPHLYLYGPKDSGKSALGESIMHFFFSGKNSDGKLKPAFSLAKSMSTAYSFANTMGRVANAAQVYNEYNRQECDDYVQGAIKASYDGESRETGSGGSFKKRKTQSAKTRGTMIIIGQYLDSSDDGSVPSRSIIPRAFSLEENKKRSDEAKKVYGELYEMEQAGISSLLLDVLSHRDAVQREFKDTFFTVQQRMVEDLRREQKQSEQRVLNNYTLCVALVKILEKRLELPFTYESFYREALDNVAAQTSLIRESNLLNIFWQTVEYLFFERQVNWDPVGHKEVKNEFKIESLNRVYIKEKGESKYQDLDRVSQIIFVQFGYLHTKFSKAYYDKYKKTAPNEASMLTYLKEQPYFIGLCPATRFDQMKTSAFMLHYDRIGVNLIRGEDLTAEERGEQPEVKRVAPKKEDQQELPMDGEDLPF